MIDVYQYITSKSLDGYKFMSGADLSYHGFNEEEKIIKQEHRASTIIYGDNGEADKNTD